MPLVSPSQNVIQPVPQWNTQELDEAVLAAFPPPTPTNSWIYYQCGTWVDVDAGVMLGVTLPSVPLTPGQPYTGFEWDALNSTSLPDGVAQNSIFPPMGSVIAQAQALAPQNNGGGSQGNGDGGGGDDEGGDGSQGNGSQSQNIHIVSEVFAQQRTSPIIYVFLIGKAVRVGFPIPVPSILSIGGQIPVLCNRPDMGEGFGQKIVGQNIAQVYAAEWRLRYAVVGQFPTSTVPVPPNPGTS